MANNVLNKVIYGGRVLMDISQDTAVKEKVLAGYTFHDANGAEQTGTCDFDAKTTDATAMEGEVLDGKTYYKNGTKKTGTMPNRGAISETIDTKDEVVTVPQGYHDGSGSVQINTVEKAKLIPENIKNGVTILGVVGSHSGEEDIKVTAGTATPSVSQQVVLPSQFGDFDYLSQVTVLAIPYAEALTPGTSGYTATIG